MFKTQRMKHDAAHKCGRARTECYWDRQAKKEVFVHGGYLPPVPWAKLFHTRSLNHPKQGIRPFHQIMQMSKKIRLNRRKITQMELLVTQVHEEQDVPQVHSEMWDGTRTSSKAPVSRFKIPQILRWDHMPAARWITYSRAWVNTKNFTPDVAG